MKKEALFRIYRSLEFAQANFQWGSSKTLFLVNSVPTDKVLNARVHV